MTEEMEWEILPLPGREKLIKQLRVNQVKARRDMQLVVDVVAGGNINQYIYNLTEARRKARKMNRKSWVVCLDIDLKLLMEMKKHD